MNPFKFIQQAIKSWHERHTIAKHQKRAQYLDNLSCEYINVTEFNGRLYIAYKGVPVVRLDDLKVKAPELLAQAREDYLLWKAKFDE